MIKKIISVFILSLMAAFSGCVKEELEECYSGLTLRYHYTLNPVDNNLFGPDINELVIHVYDSEGIFYEEFIFDDPEQLPENHTIHLPLPDGKWDIITWGSTEKGSLARSYGMGTVDIDQEGYAYRHGVEKGVTTMEDARLWIKDHTESDDGRRLVSDELSRLYYAGIYSIETRTSTEPAVHVDVPMMQNTNTLRVIINGLPDAMTRAAGDNFSVSADMVNGRYRHNNLICEHALPLKYRNGEWETVDGSIQYDLTVLRPFVDDTTSELKLAIPQLSQITLPIVPTILDSNPDINVQTDLDRANLYIFEFNFDTDMNFTLTINGWRVVNVIPGVN